MSRNKFHLFLIIGLFIQVNACAQPFTSYVNPLIGAGGHGHVFLGANVPFGAVQTGPSLILKGNTGI